MSQEVRWDVPSTVDVTAYTKSRIYRSNQEQSGYGVIDEIETVVDGNLQVRYLDPSGDMQKFYTVKFYDPVKRVEYLDFVLGFLPPTPRELRIMQTQIVGWVPDVFKPDLTDGEMFSCLQLALGAFNVFPPEVRFTFTNFPKAYESWLVNGTRINILLLKLPKLGIQDFTYTDMGLSVAIDRQAKGGASLEMLDKQYKEHLAMVKWNFSDMGVGLGTVPLAISFGGQASRNMLNMLDVFNSMGR